MTRRWASVRSRQGASIGILKRRATASTTSASQRCDGPFVQPASAPPMMLSESSGTTASSSTSIRSPSPVHTVHAPCGLLKEKLRGAGSSMEMPS